MWISALSPTRFPITGMSFLASSKDSTTTATYPSLTSLMIPFFLYFSTNYLEASRVQASGLNVLISFRKF